MNGNHGIETPHTSTPLKPEYNYLQNYSRENNDLSQNNCQDEQNQKGTRFLGTKAVAVLKDCLAQSDKHLASVSIFSYVAVC